MHDLSALEVGHHLSRVRIDPDDEAEVAVVRVLVIVVLDLHHLVAGRVRPAEALDPDLPRRVERPLQLQVQRARAEPAGAAFGPNGRTAVRPGATALGRYRFDTADGAGRRSRNGRWT